MKVIEWEAYNDVQDLKESIGTLGGWFNWRNHGQRWKDYIDCVKEEEKPYAEAIRANVLENNLRFGGDFHQHQCGVPRFEDNTIGFFSYRAWGDLMAAIWSEAEDRDYNYMDFYLTGYGDHCKL
jgi:hypothetical protein